MRVGETNPEYGGTITDISTLPVGATFWVCNGCWYGKIGLKNGKKTVQVFEDYEFRNMKGVHPLECGNVLSIRKLERSSVCKNTKK